MTHLFEQNHGARIVRQASPGALSYERQARANHKACGLPLHVSAPFSVFRYAPSAIRAPTAAAPRSRSTTSQRRRWSG
ncbi:hypothetical protein F4W67_19990 [Pseudomonas caricapapayae]|nr:hypothetical protein F4W67_19990 [Pseudomonas caricapapayae]